MSRYVDVDRPVEDLSDTGGFARHIHGVLLDAQKDPSLKFVTLLFMQKQFSEYAFGPHADRGVAGNIAHIRKELDEIEDAPLDLTEWCDVILLAMDGAARAAACAGIANPVRRVAQELFGKLAANMQREWPEWRGVPVGQAIEHVRADELAVDGRPYPDVLNTAVDTGNLEDTIRADYYVPTLSIDGRPYTPDSAVPHVPIRERRFNLHDKGKPVTYNITIEPGDPNLLSARGIVRLGTGEVMEPNMASALAALINAAHNDSGAAIQTLGTTTAATQGIALIHSLRAQLDDSNVAYANLHTDVKRAVQLAESGRISETVEWLKRTLAVQHS